MTVKVPGRDSDVSEWEQYLLECRGADVVRMATSGVPAVRPMPSGRPALIRLVNVMADPTLQPDVRDAIFTLGSASELVRVKRAWIERGTGEGRDHASVIYGRVPGGPSAAVVIADHWPQEGPCEPLLGKEVPNGLVMLCPVPTGQRPLLAWGAGGGDATRTGRLVLTQLQERFSQLARARLGYGDDEYERGMAEEICRVLEV